MSKDTLFTNDTGAAGGAVDYVKDVFQDVSLPPNSNSGLTDTAATNPLGVAFANDDSVKYGVKTLYIKDIILISDRSKWVSNKPTYQVIWNETFPCVTGYIFGNIGLSEPLTNTSYTLKATGDGFGVSGVVRRVQFIVTGNTSATATAQVAVDGVNGNTIDFSSLAAASDVTLYTRFSPYVHASSNVSKDIHDFRLTAIQASTLRVVGIVVYFENSGANIDINPGTTYVNKTKVASILGATLAVPTPGSSLGAKSLFYKTSSSGYAVSTKNCPTVLSNATGTAGTNLLTVSTGHGASYQVGGGLVVAQGTSQYIGNILNISTDTFTMGATLPFNIAAPVYRAWQSGGSFAQNASLMQLAYSIDFSKYGNFSGASQAILDPYGRFALWGKGIGVSLIDNVQALVLSPSGFFQTDGYFSGAEFEMIGDAIFHATLSINGVVGYNINVGQTGGIKRNVFTGAGPGWNSVNVGFGSSMGIAGIKQINFYNVARDMGVSYGMLAELETSQAYVNRGTVNATLMSLGLARRVYADQLYFKGAWVRGSSAGAAGGAYYNAPAAAYFKHEYYGKDFAIIGDAPGGSLLLDGNTIPMTFNVMQPVATEGFHKVEFTVGAGSSAQVQAFDFVSSHGEMKVLQKVNDIPLPAPPKAVTSEVTDTTGAGHGSIATKIRRLETQHTLTGTAITRTYSSTQGNLYLINEDGKYQINYVEHHTSQYQWGISRNSTQLTTSLNGTIATTILNVALSPNTVESGLCVSWTGRLYVGDLIRPHTDGGPTSTDVFARFNICKVGD